MAKQEQLNDEELAQISAGKSTCLPPPRREPPVGPGPGPEIPDCDVINCEDQALEHMSQSEG